MYDSCISRGQFFGLKRSTYARVNTVVGRLPGEHNFAWLPELSVDAKSHNLALSVKFA